MHRKLTDYATGSLIGRIDDLWVEHVEWRPRVYTHNPFNLQNSTNIVERHHSRTHYHGPTGF
jgi:hypothetical protein